jgi:hypothetical protein
MRVGGPRAPGWRRPRRLQMGCNAAAAMPGSRRKAGVGATTQAPEGTWPTRYVLGSKALLQFSCSLPENSDGEMPRQVQ